MLESITGCFNFYEEAFVKKEKPIQDLSSASVKVKVISN